MKKYRICKWLICDDGKPFFIERKLIGHWWPVGFLHPDAGFFTLRFTSVKDAERFIDMRHGKPQAIVIAEIER